MKCQYEISWFVNDHMSLFYASPEGEYSEAKRQVAFKIEITKDWDKSFMFTNMMMTSVSMWRIFS